MSDPWLKFYPTDWRADPRLRMCSLAARGLWIEMIALMHEATPYGHLLVSGHSPTDAQLAVLAGAPPAQVPELLGELEAAGVFSRTSALAIYSRKMTRMAKKAAVARKNGKSGGNPKLCSEREKPPSDNPPLKARDKPQKPEARSQNKREAKASLVRLDRFAEFWDVYPHRDGRRNRKGAEDRYHAAVRSGVSEQDIIDGARRAHGDRRVLAGYARDPTTWLNQLGWLDEVPAAEIHPLKPEAANVRQPSRLDAFLSGARSVG
jgi:hypothetical protein